MNGAGTTTYYRRVNEFALDALNGTTIMCPAIKHKLKVFNVRVRRAGSVYRAERNVYFVNWFYNTSTNKYCTLSGINGRTAYYEETDLEGLLDVFGMMFGFDV